MANQTKNKPKVTSNKAANKPTGPKTNWLIPAGILAGILLLTYFIYQPALNYGFTNWDDDVYVTENPIIAHPENIHAMLTTPIGGNYHPLTIYSLAYDYAKTANLPAEEQGHRFHAVNLFFHLINILLVFYFVYLFSNRRMWMSLACALFFAIHPMHVESVAWIAERKDVLYTFFFMLSLIAYLLYRDQAQVLATKTESGTSRAILWLTLCLLAFILSLASKPAAVILPLVLLAIDFFNGRKFDLRNIIEKVPFFLLSLAAGLLTVKAQQASGAISDKVSYTIAERILFPFYGLMMYSIKLFYPFHLSAVYPFPNVEGKPMGVEFYIAPVVVLLVAGAILYFGKGKRILLFGLLFFVVNLILILQFFNVGQAIISERYTYIAYLGPLMMLTWWLDEKEKISPNIRWSLVGFLSVLAVVCIAQSRERVKVWQTDETLWSDVIEKFPRRVPDSYNNRGYYYRHHGQPQKALADYDVAISLDPHDAKPWGNRGNVFFDAHIFDSAIANYNRALTFSNKEWETFSNRGASRAQTGDLQGAVQDLTMALSGDSTNISAWTNRALVHTMLNEHEAAISDYRHAEHFNPYADNIINAIGVEYQHMGKFTESITEFTKAIALAPNAGLYYLNRSYSWNGAGNKANALQDMQKAQQLGIKVPEEYARMLAN